MRPPRRFRLWMLLLAVALVAVPLAVGIRLWKERDAERNVCFVLGDVVRPGKYATRGGPTVLRMIDRAGGFRPTADRNSIQLVRPALPQHPGWERTLLFQVNYDAIVNRGDQRTNLPVQPDDRIYVYRRPAADSPQPIVPGTH